MAKLPTTQKVFDVVGEGRDNDDGSSRQGELTNCQPGEAVELVRQPNNPYDPNAVFVRSCRSIGIGFLTRDDAAILAPAIDSGRQYAAKLHALTGGVADYPSYGAKVSIAWDGKPEHPHRPLDANQIASRRGRRTIQGRERDERGRLKAKQGTGCALAFALMVPAALMVAVLTLSGCGSDETSGFDFKTIGNDTYAMIGDASQSADAWTAAAKKQCEGKQICQVMGWTDPKLAASAMPMLDREVNAMAFDYTLNRKSSHERSLFNCRVFAGKKSSECIATNEGE